MKRHLYMCPNCKTVYGCENQSGGGQMSNEAFEAWFEARYGYLSSPTQIELALKSAKECWNAAYARALEDAAKVADVWVDSPSCCVSGGTCTHQQLAYTIAEKIRALAEKGESK